MPAIHSSLRSCGIRGTVLLILSGTCLLAETNLACFTRVVQAAPPPTAAPGDYKSQLPRVAPHSPAEALATFRVAPGFHLEQVAVEPLIRDPIALEFDENGRLYVVQMIDYSEQDKDFLGSIQLLEDTNGDGKFDKSTLFADKLSWPTALFCYDGGLFVGAAPHIYYLKDTTGDGRADLRELVYTGFNRHNVQGMLNSFHWGLDNRIHGATGTAGGRITRPDCKTCAPVNLDGRDFAFDPASRILTATSGGAQHGMCFDDWGRKFGCSNSDHIQLVMFEDRYVARNPYLPAPTPRISIAADGPQAEVFRISPVEQWRIIRTQLRVSGQVQGAIEGGGRAAGYFTGATGTTIYRGNAFPPGFRGQAFVGDVGSNIVHRKTITPQGISLLANRADTGREFVASTDTWFRPAQFANAPDGTLYIADMYREVIEHPASIPREIKQHLDLTSGRDRGRIYRLVPEGFRQPPLPKLGSAKLADLVLLLEHPNAWHRETAARLLATRHNQAAIPLLRNFLESTRNPLGRLHALYALDGLRGLNEEILLRALSDSDAGVREHAVRLSETLARQEPELVAAICGRANDPAPRVRYQVAFSLGEFTDSRRIPALISLLRREGGESWFRLALLSSLVNDADLVFDALAEETHFRESAAGMNILSQLARQVGSQAQAKSVATVLARLEQLGKRDPLRAAALLGQLTTGLARTRSPLLATVTGKNAELLQNSIQQAQRLATDAQAPVAQRLEAIPTLGLGKFSALRNTFVELLQQRQPRDVQAMAVSTLGRFSEPEIAGIVIEAWSGFGPSLRRSASEVLFSRSAWLLQFLAAVEQEQIPRGDLDMSRLALLKTHADPAVRAQGTALAERFKLGRRGDVLAAYQPALKLTGDVVRGRALFKKTCIACHRLEGEGYEIGPNLGTIKSRGAEAILLNLLDPNREVNPQFVNYVISTRGGKSITGLIAGETATSISLKRAENQTDTVLRLDIDEMRSTGLSLMPEGLEKDLNPQAVADLIAYLLQVP